MRHKRTKVINPDAPLESLEAKQPDIDLGIKCYDKNSNFDPKTMLDEWEKVWTRSWLLAGVTSDLSDVGDYFLFNIFHESIIVTLTKEGIKAFYNVCSHRGAILVDEPRGNQKVFVCPFHNWTFRNTGDLIRITDEDTFDPRVVGHRPGLVSVSCETHAGIIFVNLHNVTHRNQTIHSGEKIAQAVFVKITTDVSLVESDNIYDEDTSRGNGALGSTGNR